MNHLLTKSNSELYKVLREKSIKVAGDIHSPLFCLTDVARYLGDQNRSKSVADIDEMHKHLITTESNGGHQSTIFLTEFGLYQYLIGSNKPKAKKFKEWICNLFIAIRREMYMDAFNNREFRPKADYVMKTYDNEIVTLKKEIQNLKEIDGQNRRLLLDYHHVLLSSKPSRSSYASQETNDYVDILKERSDAIKKSQKSYLKKQQRNNPHLYYTDADGITKPKTPKIHEIRGTIVDKYEAARQFQTEVTDRVRNNSYSDDSEYSYHSYDD